MSKITRTVTAAIFVVASIVVPASGAAAQIPDPPTACPEADLIYIVSKCAAWVARDISDQAFASATSPDGTTTYALGQNYTSGRFDTIAYDTATGAIRWRSSHVGGLSTLGGNLAVAPDGTVFVTGWSYEGTWPPKIITIAYDATGAEKWVKISQSQWAHYDAGSEITVSPDSQTVYVGADAYHQNPDGTDNRSDDYYVLALNASNGAQRWATSFDSVENQFAGGDMIEAITASPDGNHVVVTGRWGTANGTNYGTISLNTATGAKEWFDRYTGGAQRFDQPYDVVFSPDSSRVFVTGDSYGGFGYQRATVAYNSVTGARVWEVRYAGGSGWTDFGRALAISPDGEVLYLTGESVGGVDNPTNTFGNTGASADISTEALDADTGEQIWDTRYSVPRGSHSDDIVVSPDGSAVYVAGATWTFTAGWNIVTLAYDATTGAEQWVARYSSAKSGIGDQDDWDPFISIAPDGSRVFTVGTAGGSPDGGKGVVTIAYDTARAL